MIPEDQARPSWRKPAGAALILAIIAAWAWLVVSMIEEIGPLDAWLAIPIYATAGIAWILPLRPILSWMETGRWR